ncbi:MAG TPA: phenylalanine--tRNA ligase subunit alpha, partial [Acidimicrobiaceae bacterium]|nr:phenylalanine--tRNA ligase subunit alpha [Acidimicrobiaceae bacterium]
KKGPFATFKTRLGGLATVDEKKAAGQAVNEATEAVEAAADARRAELKRAERALQLAAERIDLTETMHRPGRGHAHVVTQAWQRLEDVFVGMGFQVAEGPEVETDWYNFEALNMPPQHPARSMHDTFYVDHGTAGSTVLRTHTSPVQIRVMQTIAPPIYMVMPGRVFRNETTDATHLAVFHQIEGLVIDRGITLADLAGTIEKFTQAFFGPGFTSRLRPSFFPFTEP